jgi:viroplasmin and RNaseH domain-containing protein
VGRVPDGKGVGKACPKKVKGFKDALYRPADNSEAANAAVG